jgi:hypothetical protein
MTFSLNPSDNTYKYLVFSDAGFDFCPADPAVSDLAPVRLVVSE